MTSDLVTRLTALDTLRGASGQVSGDRRRPGMNGALDRL